MELKSVRNWIKEKSDVRMELKITGILHAGCFLLHGLPKEYNIQSDCPIHEWIRLLKVGVHDGFKLLIKSIFRVSEHTRVYMCCIFKMDLEFDKGHITTVVLLSRELLCEQNLYRVIKYEELKDKILKKTTNKKKKIYT